MIEKTILTALLAALPLTVSALPAFDRMVLEELSCARDPKPTGILQALVAAGKIDPKDNIGYDSMSCWKIKGGISVAGMTFQSVCAFEEDEMIQSYNPDLYRRGPGTSPGQRLSFGAAVSGDQLADWYMGSSVPRRSVRRSPRGTGLRSAIQARSAARCGCAERGRKTPTGARTRSAAGGTRSDALNTLKQNKVAGPD